MATSTAAQQPTGLARWTPSLPTNIMSMLNPFGAEDSNKESANAKAIAEDNVNNQSIKRPILAAFHSDPAAFGPPSPSISDGSIMFAEPESRGTSEADSQEGSVNELRRSKRSNRPKTEFSICHPPPASSTRQKFHRRPRSLMQLHKLSPSARPIPAFNIIPSANFSVRLTRAITKVFKAKHGLCPNDLVVLRAEKYSNHEHDDEQEARDIIGLICKGRKEDGATAVGKAKICMSEGKEWEAYPLMNGGYEFFSTDEHGLGLTVRWVPKRARNGSKGATKRFNFSTISPNSRRHPVIAGLSRTGLGINDTYRMPDPAAATPMSTPKSRDTVLEDALDEDDPTQENDVCETDVCETDVCETDAARRTIIIITAIWVAFREGWSPHFKYDEKDCTAQRSTSTPNSPTKGTASPISIPPGSPVPSAADRRTSIRSVGSSILSRSSLMSKGNRNSTISNTSTDFLPRRTVSAAKTGRSRGDSASTVLVHRAASNRRKNNQQASWRPDVLSAQHELKENSRDDLNRTPPPQTRLATIDSPATKVEEPTPRPVRMESVARPFIPQPQNGEGSKQLPESSVDKRESTTTTDTNASETPRKGSARKTSAARKRGGWRRVLCGGGDI